MNDGGPAFPMDEHGGSMVGPDGVTYYQHSAHPGMSLRAYFAGQAMQAAIAGRECALDPQVVAATSVIFAEALIAALEVRSE